jgi:16S rRNA (adenine1518-N6/adenine1519-N6)-dimethyltransferase
MGGLLTMMDEKVFHGTRAKKKFGQHFLNDRNIIKKIVEAASIKEGELVLEIGPGTGMLTRELLDAGGRVIALEVDDDLIGPLEKRFHGRELTIVKSDALKVSYEALSAEHGGRFKLVANLPYYISGPLLSKLLTERAAFTIMVLMFQKEVAVRIAPAPVAATTATSRSSPRLLPRSKKSSMFPLTFSRPSPRSTRASSASGCSPPRRSR